MTLKRPAAELRLSRGDARWATLVGGDLWLTGLCAGKLGILERYGVRTHVSGGPRQPKVHGHPIIPWERVVSIGSEVVVRD